MNAIISKHFNKVETRFLESSVITSYNIIRREVTDVDGKLRAKIALADGGMAELFEYVGEFNGQIHLKKYSFHWQTASKKLKKRWDNAPHFPDLPRAPHHIHCKDGSVNSAPKIPSIFSVLDEIEEILLPSKNNNA